MSEEEEPLVYFARFTSKIYPEKLCEECHDFGAFRSEFYYYEYEQVVIERYFCLPHHREMLNSIVEQGFPCEIEPN